MLDFLITNRFKLMFLNLFYLIKCIHYSNHLIRLKTPLMAALHFPKPKEEFMNFRKCGYNDGECILFNLLLICSKASKERKELFMACLFQKTPVRNRENPYPGEHFFQFMKR